MAEECIKKLSKYDYTDFNKTVELNLGRILKEENLFKDTTFSEYKIATLVCEQIIANIYNHTHNHTHTHTHNSPHASEKCALIFEVKDNAKETIDSCFSQAFDIPELSSYTSREIKYLFEQFLSEKYASIRNLYDINIPQFQKSIPLWPFGNHIIKLHYKVHDTDGIEILDESWYISILNPANSI